MDERQDKIKIEFLGKTPKKIELPIPFVSKSAKTGEVTCNPVGEFPRKDGEALLSISGPNGLFRLVDGDLVYETKTTVSEPMLVPTVEVTEPVINLCQCECGGQASPGKRYLPGHHFRKKKTSAISE